MVVPKSSKTNHPNFISKSIKIVATSIVKSLMVNSRAPLAPQGSSELKIGYFQLNARAVGRSKNPGVPVLFGGLNLPHLVEIELTDLPKSRGAMAPPGTKGLQ